VTAIRKGDLVRSIPRHAHHVSDTGVVVREIPQERSVVVRWEAGPIKEHIVQDLVLLRSRPGR
jgi:hypothetical protein